MRLRGHRLLACLAIATLLSGVGIGPVAHAQDDPVADSFCAVITVDEVNQAMHSRVLASPSFGGCSWSWVDASVPFVSMSASWDDRSLDERKAANPGGTDVTVGGHPGYYLEEGQTLYVQLDQGLFVIGAGSKPAEGVVMQDALMSLAALAVERQASLVAPPAPATPAPRPSNHADTELEALIPATIGGQPLTVQTMTGQQVFGSTDAQSLQAINDTLATQGKTIADVSVLIAYPADYSSVITAVRVKGGDAAAFTPPLIAALSTGTETAPQPGQVAGKDVTVLTVSSQQQYAYPHGDTVWVVAAVEPALTEIFTALP
jgi:hypothetical protein